MNSKQYVCKSFSELNKIFPEIQSFQPQLLLIVAGRKWFEENDMSHFKKSFPQAVVMGCSTAGEISPKGVSDNTLVISALKFKNPIFETSYCNFSDMSESFKAGQSLVKKFDPKRTTSIFLLGKGLGINGSKLVEGIQTQVDKRAIISGGLAGDGANFEKTYVLLNDKVFNDGVIALGIYDQSVQLSTGSQGGWKPFGPVRQVTKAHENILYTIDGRRALDVYKEYLGEQAKKLPGSGLLFPLEILSKSDQKSGVIRTILAIDEKEGSITFAGEIGEGKFCRLMHTQNEGLVEGAKSAAQMCLKSTLNPDKDSFAFLVSCVGRKLVMSDEIDDEVDAVKEVLSLKDNVIGFYSYGEISPSSSDNVSALHNQTMTITYFKDAA